MDKRWAEALRKWLDTDMLFGTGHMHCPFVGLPLPGDSEISYSNFSKRCKICKSMFSDIHADGLFGQLKDYIITFVDWIHINFDNVYYGCHYTCPCNRIGKEKVIERVKEVLDNEANN